MTRRRPAVEQLEARLTPSTDQFPLPAKESLSIATPADPTAAAMIQPHLFFVFVGSSWNTTTGQQVQANVLAGAGDILRSNFLTGDSPAGGLRQYGFGGTANLLADLQDPTHIVVEANNTLSIVRLTAASDVNQVALQTFLSNEPVPQPNPAAPDWRNSTVYVVVGDKTVSGDAHDYGENDPWTVNLNAPHGAALAEMVWLGWSDILGPNGQPDGMTRLLSHELAEGMAGVTVNVQLPSGTQLAGQQIADNDAQKFTDRLAGGAGTLVQSYWSKSDGDFVIPGGQISQTDSGGGGGGGGGSGESEHSSSGHALAGDITGLVAAPLTPAPKRGKGKSRGYKETLTIVNVSGQPLEGPLSVELRGLKGGIKLRGASGSVGRKGRKSPFVEIDVAGGVLQPGDSASIVIQFSGKPNRFTLAVFANADPT